MIKMAVRSPIIAVLGHVDHGKTQLLDSVRGTAVVKREAGGITQMIGASYIPKGIIEGLSGEFAKRMNITLKIPGLLFIDTPGHEAFTNLRERGGSIADMAILIVDINQGFQPQTIESIKILKQYKTPFIIAANKIDIIHGWNVQKTTSFLETFSKQSEIVKQRIDEKIYGIMGKISEYGFDSERFDRLTDFTKQVSIVPVSAKTKEGIGELLVLIAGMSQKFLEKNLQIEVSGPGKASIIEVKEEKGMGHTVDIILYDGVMKRGDEILFLTNNGAKKTKIRGLLLPNTSSNNPNEKYMNVDEVHAASGIKILAPNLESALPGSPVVVIEDEEKDRKEIEKHFKKIIFETEKNGVIVKADSLGSIEALIELLKEKKVPIKEASVGKINKKDILSAHSVAKKDKYLGVVLGFNVAVLDEAREESESAKTKLISSDIIYKVIENYEEWVKDEKEKEKKEVLENLPHPARIKFLKGCCFRACRPAIIGVEVLGGKIKVGTTVMDKNGKIIGEIKSIQHEKETKQEAEKGMQVALSCQEMHVGKNIEEGELMLTYMNKEQIKLWKSKMELLDSDSQEILEQIERIIIKSAF
ncbi:translation initiation factor IF-2 [Candidatus Micrarchaeota archaeon]|nr:translation initiation factor IF-2 [Candidatus Micrarchaeota archaeon]